MALQAVFEIEGMTPLALPAAPDMATLYRRLGQWRPPAQGGVDRVGIQVDGNGWWRLSARLDRGTGLWYFAGLTVGPAAEAALVPQICRPDILLSGVAPQLATCQTAWDRVSAALQAAT